MKMQQKKGYIIQEYHSAMYEKVIAFLDSCFRETGRTLDLEEKHKIFKDIKHNFDVFLCLVDDETIIGTAAIRRLNDTACELKTLFLYEKYQGKGLGKQLLSHAMLIAEMYHYEFMYLDCLAENNRARHLYEKAGFEYTERYNENANDVVFMKKSLRILSR